LNRILTAIDAGLEDGNFYTATNSASERNAWEVVKQFAPHKTEAQCREVIAAWVKSSTLAKFDYVNPATRKAVKGLRVDPTKRPS
jgi:hypothetical protein